MIAVQDVLGVLALPLRFVNLLLEEGEALFEIGDGHLEGPYLQVDLERGVIEQIERFSYDRFPKDPGFLTCQEVDKVIGDPGEAACREQCRIPGLFCHKCLFCRYGENLAVGHDPHTLIKDLFKECESHLAFGFGEIIDLVQDKEDPGNLLPHLPEEVHLNLGDWWIGRDQEEGGVTLGEEVEGHLGIMPVG
jgi:hypothetical protein